MATNVYRAEERIEFKRGEPSSFFGWYISTSSTSHTVTSFRTAEDRDRFIAAVEAKLVPGDDNTPEFIAAFTLLATSGSGESAREEGWWALDAWLNDPRGERVEALMQLAQEWELGE